MDTTHRVTFHPLDKTRWNDFENLFGRSGACSGCWCYYFLCPSRREYDALGSIGHHDALKALVEDGFCPGLIGYRDENPVVWVAVAPREKYLYLSRSRILAPVDARAVWSIVCLFVSRKNRNQGLTRLAIVAVINHVRAHGGKTIEAYATDPGEKKISHLSGYTGFASTYKSLGFTEVARRSPTRPIFRLELD